MIVWESLSWNASITCGSSASVPGPRVIGQMMCSIGLPSSGWMNRCAPLLDQLEQEHAEDGFDKPFFLKLMTGDGASKPENLGTAGKRLEGLHRTSGIEQVEGLYLAPSEQLRNRTGAHDGPDNPQHEDEGCFGTACRTSLGTDDERMD